MLVLTKISDIAAGVHPTLVWDMATDGFMPSPARSSMTISSDPASSDPASRDEVLTEIASPEKSADVLSTSVWERTVGCLLPVVARRKAVLPDTALSETALSNTALSGKSTDDLSTTERDRAVRGFLPLVDRLKAALPEPALLELAISDYNQRDTAFSDSNLRDKTTDVVFMADLDRARDECKPSSAGIFTPGTSDNTAIVISTSVRY